MNIKKARLIKGVIDTKFKSDITTEGKTEKTIELVKHFEPKGNQRDAFGDGKAAERIVEILATDGYY